MTRITIENAARRSADPTYRAEYERAGAEIAQMNSIIRDLDEARCDAGMSKAELARRIGRDGAVVRRLFTAEVNPELRPVAEVANALDVELKVRRKRRSKRSVPSAL